MLSLGHHLHHCSRELLFFLFFLGKWKYFQIATWQLPNRSPLLRKFCKNLNLLISHLKCSCNVKKEDIFTSQKCHVPPVNNDDFHFYNGKVKLAVLVICLHITLITFNKVLQMCIRIGSLANDLWMLLLDASRLGKIWKGSNRNQCSVCPLLCGWHQCWG